MSSSEITDLAFRMERDGRELITRFTPTASALSKSIFHEFNKTRVRAILSEPTQYRANETSSLNFYLSLGYLKGAVRNYETLPIILGQAKSRGLRSLVETAAERSVDAGLNILNARNTMLAEAIKSRQGRNFYTGLEDLHTNQQGLPARILQEYKIEPVDMQPVKMKRELSGPSTYAIVRFLATGDSLHSIKEISNGSGLSETALKKRLRLLLQEKVLRAQKVNGKPHYCLNEDNEKVAKYVTGFKRTKLEEAMSNAAEMFSALSPNL